MKTTVGALHLNISVGVQALQRYPAGCSTLIEAILDKCFFCLYVHICINFDAASDPQLYSDANWAQKLSPSPLPLPFPLPVPTPL